MNPEERYAERPHLRHKYFTKQVFSETVRRHGLRPLQGGLASWLCQQLQDVPHPAYVADLELASVALPGWMRGYSESLRGSPELRVTLLVYVKLHGHGTPEGVCVTVPTSVWLELPETNSCTRDAAPAELASGAWLKRDYDALEADGLHSYEEWMDEALREHLAAHWARERGVEPRFIPTPALARAIASTAPEVQMDCVPHRFLVDRLDHGPHPVYYAGGSEPSGPDALVLAIVRVKLRGLDDVKTIALRLPAKDWCRLPRAGSAGLLAQP